MYDIYVYVYVLLTVKSFKIGRNYFGGVGVTIPGPNLDVNWTTDVCKCNHAV